MNSPKKSSSYLLSPHSGAQCFHVHFRLSLSSFQDEQPAEGMGGHAVFCGFSCLAVHGSAARHGSGTARVWHQSTPLSPWAGGSCITKPFARWMCNSSDRSQGRAITQILAGPTASPASGKSNKTIWLYRAQQDSGLCVYTHQLPALPYNSSCYRKPS